MGLRFYRRVSLLPGVRLNIGTRSTSLSFGHRGAWLTTGAHGRRATFGIPGSGLRYTTSLGGSRAASRRPGAKPAPCGICSLFTLALVVAGAWFVYKIATALGIGGT